MRITRIRRTGKTIASGMAVLCAVLCLSGSFPGSRGVFAEEVDAVVEDSSAAEDAAMADAVSGDAGAGGESAAPGTDPALIEGLFEVTGEQAGYSGEETETSDKKKGKDKGKEKKKDEKKLIVGYRQVGVQASIHFEMGEKPSLDRVLQQAPSSLDVYFLGEKKPQNLSCTWESYGDDYSSTNLNYYFFIPKFDSDKYEVKGLNLQSESPYIEVIQDAFTFEMIESAPPKENEAAVYKYCKDVLHLNTAAACGILANIYCESGFRTNAIGDGGTSVGLCQWHNSRWTNLRNFAPDDWQTLEGQLRFMRRELMGGYSRTLKYIRGVSDDEQGAYDAAYFWCMHYEMPDRILSRSTTRAYLAKNVYWKRYGLGEEETESESQTGEETESETRFQTGEETESETRFQTGEETESETRFQTGEETESEIKAGEAAQTGTGETGPETETEGSKVKAAAKASAPETESETEVAAETGMDGTKEDETKEAETKEDGAKKGKTKEDGAKEGETKENGAKEGETKENGAKEDETKAAERETDETKTEPEAAAGKMDVSYAGTYRCISDDGLNIREERSTEVDVAGFIPFNGIVTVHRADGEWAWVTYGEEKGYSKLEYLERIVEETETGTEE